MKPRDQSISWTRRYLWDWRKNFLDGCWIWTQICKIWVLHACIICPLFQCSLGSYNDGNTMAVKGICIQHNTVHIPAPRKNSLHLPKCHPIIKVTHCKRSMPINPDSASSGIIVKSYLQIKSSSPKKFWGQNFFQPFALGTVDQEFCQYIWLQVTISKEWNKRIPSPVIRIHHVVASQYPSYDL